MTTRHEENPNPIKALREKAGLSRRDLALKASLPYGTLASLEVGRPSHVGVYTQCQLSLVLKVSPERLDRDYKQWRASFAEKGQTP